MYYKHTCNTSSYIIRVQGHHIHNQIPAQVRPDILAVLVMIVHVISTDHQIGTIDEHQLNRLREIRVKGQEQFPFLVVSTNTVLQTDKYLVGNRMRSTAYLDALHFRLAFHFKVHIQLYCVVVPFGEHEGD